MLDYQKLYIAERNRCEELEEELRQYRGGTHDSQPTFVERLPVHLRPRERVFLQTMLELPPGALVDNGKFETALLSSERAYVHEYNSTIVKTVACTLRQKLEPLGVKIETIWGKGYSMPRESHDAWKRAIAV